MITNEKVLGFLHKAILLVLDDRFKDNSAGVPYIISTDTDRIKIWKNFSTGTGNIAMVVEDIVISRSRYVVYLDSEKLNDHPYFEAGNSLQINGCTFIFDTCGRPGLSLNGEHHDIDISNIESTLFQISLVKDDVPLYTEVEPSFKLCQDIIQNTIIEHVKFSNYENGDILYEEELLNGITSLYKS